MKNKTNNLKRLAFFHHFTHFILGKNISNLSLILSISMDRNNLIELNPKYRKLLMNKLGICRMTLHRQINQLIEIGFIKHLKKKLYMINPMFIVKDEMSKQSLFITLMSSYYTSKNMKPKMVDFIVQNYTRETAKRYLKKMEIDI